MISKNKKMVQIVVTENTYRFINSLRVLCKTSISKCANKLLEYQIAAYGNLDDKDFVDVLEKLIKEFQNEEN